MKLSLKACSVLAVALSVAGAHSQQKVAIVYDHAIPQLQFGVQEFESAFKAARLQYSAGPAGAVVVTFYAG
jgi:hypothetical protein